ncbi:TetR/AcrR family transcriptional regulator [Longicatena caecimuris]|uniref:TetR/AcrR family transcriptional regulator n=1 Tax=Longicatena caecimuris TaxID=1796635 RepID=UPI0018A9C8D7|nr:TetR/AcrR family transcriptional regulator [Longicatena caecimuris]
MQVLKDDIQESILNSAKELFLNYGYEKTSMDKISKKAGISKSNLYNYFHSKDEIFCALTDSAATRFQNIINHFDTNRFSPKFGENGFSEMLSAYIYSLIADYKDGLVLIMKCSTGTKYEQLREQLINQIAEKFLRDYAVEFHNTNILVRVIAENLFDGITAIAIQSNTEHELKESLNGFIKYHSCGFFALISR